MLPARPAGCAGQREGSPGFSVLFSGFLGSVVFLGSDPSLLRSEGCPDLPSFPLFPLAESVRSWGADSLGMHPGGGGGGGRGARATKAQLLSQLSPLAVTQQIPGSGSELSPARGWICVRAAVTGTRGHRGFSMATTEMLLLLLLLRRWSLPAFPQLEKPEAVSSHPVHLGKSLTPTWLLPGNRRDWEGPS